MEFLKVFNELCNYTGTSVEDKEEFFEGTIQTFFGGSKIEELTGLNNGKYDIRTLYEKVSEGEDDIHIKSVNLNESLNIYTEYLEGMIKFINDIKNVNIEEGEDISKYSDKFDLAIKNDFNAVESMFGGETNPTVDMTLEGAVSNVDFLVDLIPSIKNFYKEVQQITEACHDACNDISYNGEENNLKSYLLTNCVDMIDKSVTHFCESALRNSFISYESLIDAIYTEPTVERVEDDEKFILLY